jgi:hypothetical protein
LICFDDFHLQQVIADQKAMIQRKDRDMTRLFDVSKHLETKMISVIAKSLTAYLQLTFQNLCQQRPLV